MARLSINWRSATEVAPTAPTTGEAEAESVKKQAIRSDKPMLIYVTSDDPTDKETRKLESVVFANEKVGVGSKFFDCVKVSAGNALQDRLLKESGDTAPRLIFITRDYEVADVLQNRQITGGKLLKAMKKVVKKEYVSSFETMVRSYIKLLNDLDRLESQKAAIADQRRRLQEKPNKSREKKIERKEKEYQQDMEAWSKEEQKILQLRKKGDPKPEA